MYYQYINGAKRKKTLMGIGMHDIIATICASSVIANHLHQEVAMSSPYATFKQAEE
jgi:hypothetical protein